MSQNQYLTDKSSSSQLSWWSGISQLQLTPVVAVDFGSDRVRAWFNGQVVVDEASLVAFQIKTQKILAVGQAAADLKSRLSQKVAVVAPMQAAELVDPDLAYELLKYVLSQALKGQFFSPVVVIGLSVAADKHVSAQGLSTKAQLTEILYRLGAKEVIGVAQPLAAAIGAGVPVADVSGGLVAVLGGGSVEVGVVAMGSLAAAETHSSAGQGLIQAVQVQLAQVLGVQISQESAVMLLNGLARVGSTSKAKTQLVTGKAVANGAPEEVEVRPIDLTPAIQVWVTAVEQTINNVLCQLAPELTTDVVTKGLLLTGGLAELDGLEAYLVKKLGIPVAAVANPELAVLRGLATVCQNLDQYRQSLAYEG